MYIFAFGSVVRISGIAALLAAHIASPGFLLSWWLSLQTIPTAFAVKIRTQFPTRFGSGHDVDGVEVIF